MYFYTSGDYTMEASAYRLQKFLLRCLGFNGQGVITIQYRYDRPSRRGVLRGYERIGYTIKSWTPGGYYPERTLLLKLNHMKSQPIRRYYLHKFQNELIKKATKFELELKRKLERHYKKVKFQKILYGPGYNFIVDFYLPSHGLIIEVDGQRHYTKEGILKDQIRDAKLRSLGYSVLRLENKEVFEINIKQRIDSFLKEVRNADPDY